MEKHREAVENFKKALELEPDNESYKSNLQIAEDKVRCNVNGFRCSCSVHFSNSSATCHLCV